MNSAAPLAQFRLLSADEQRAAVRRLAAQGWSDQQIARTCGLHIEQVRRAIAERDDHTPGAMITPASCRND